MSTTEVLITKSAGMLVSKIAAKIIEKIKTGVIQYWSDRRLKSFIEAFIYECGKELIHDEPSREVDSLLNELVNDEKKSELLFESCRKVILSASKELGPRMIGLLTAKAIVKNESLSDVEELFMMAAENLNDVELRAFRKFFADHHPLYLDNPADFPSDNSGLKQWIRVPIDGQDEVNERGPFHRGSASFVILFGTWAQKLRNLGMVREEILFDDSLQGHRLDLQKGKVSSSPQHARETTWSLVIEPQYFEFATLIDRAEQTLNNLNPVLDRQEVGSGA